MQSCVYPCTCSACTCMHITCSVHACTCSVHADTVLVCIIIHAMPQIFLVYFLQMSTFTVLGQPRWAYRWLPAVVSDLTTLSPSSTTSQLELYAISDCRLLCPCYTLSILLLLLYPHNHRPLVMCLHNHRPHNHRPLVMTQLHLPQLKCYNCIWLLYCVLFLYPIHSLLIRCAGYYHQTIMYSAPTTLWFIKFANQINDTYNYNYMHAKGSRVIELLNKQLFSFPWPVLSWHPVSV